jgi:hypothetical protein
MYVFTNYYKRKYNPEGNTTKTAIDAPTGSNFKHI